MKTIKTILFLIILLTILGYHPRPVLATTNTTVTFNLSNSRHIPKAIHSVNQNWYTSIRIDNNLMAEAINRLNFSDIRFSGGTVANYYDWTALSPDWDYILAHCSSLSFVCTSKSKYDIHVKTLSAIDFAKTITSYGRDNSFTLNLYTNTPEEIITALQKLKDNGIQIKRFELGNEMYGYTDLVSNDKYIRRAKTITTAIRQKFPDAKVSVVINKDLLNNSHKVSWDIPNENWFDAVVIHHYVLSRPPDRIVQWLTQNRLIEFDAFVNRVKAKYPGKELWLTEWNLREDPDYGVNYKYTNAYAHSYYVYSFLLNALRYPMITTANYHSLSTGDPHITVFRPKKTYKQQYFGSSPQQVPSGTYHLDQFFWKQASYWPMYWIGDSFKKFNKMTISDTQNLLAVYFYSQSQPQKGNVALVNKSGTSLKLSFSGIDLAGQSLKLSTLIKSWDQVSSEGNEMTPTVTNVSLSNITIPAYAIAYLETTSAPAPNPADLVDTGDTSGDQVNQYDANQLKADFGKTGVAG